MLPAAPSRLGTAFVPGWAYIGFSRKDSSNNALQIDSNLSAAGTTVLDCADRCQSEIFCIGLGYK